LAGCRREGSALVVVAATRAVAGVFQPARRRIQLAVELLGTVRRRPIRRPPVHDHEP
jgi:hypothetical protein